MLRHLTYANVTASLALFLALGGVGYAAATLPRGSVGATQLKANAVTGAKVKDRSLTAKDFKGALAGPRGATGPAGAPGAAGAVGPAGPQGPQGVPGTPDGYTKAEADTRFGSTMRLFTAVGFETESGVAVKQQGSSNKCVTPVVDGTTRMMRELQLPQGALVTKIEVRYVDNLANNIDFQLRAADRDGDVNSYSDVATTTGATTTIRTVTITPNDVLGDDSDLRTPFLEATLDNDGTTNLRVCSVKAFYTV